VKLWRGSLIGRENQSGRGVVLDSLSELRLLAQNPLAAVSPANPSRLKHFFGRVQNARYLMLDDRTAEPQAICNYIDRPRRQFR